MEQPGYLDSRKGTHPFSHDSSARRPHVLVISVDMIPPESYAPGHPIREHLRTPNLDRLMGDGVRFTHAFSCSPLCGPSRAGYLTGRYPYLLVNEERAHDGSEYALRPSDAIFPEYLRATGYVTKHAGKCHVGAAKFLDAFGENASPWDRWAAPLGDDDAYLRYLRDMGLVPHVWSDPLRGLRPDKTTAGNSYGGWVVQPDGREFPPEATYSRYLARLAADHLQAAVAQREDRPIYLQVDFFAPHQPFFVPTCYRERARELAEHIELPESYSQAMNGETQWPRVYEFYKWNWGLYDPEAARRYMLMNFLQVEALDGAIGELLAAVDRLGLYEQSAVIFLGDHGEMNCERGLVDKGVYGHPKVARVPLSLKLPGDAVTGRQVDAPVSLLDIAPTILELGGVTVTDRLDGQSLLPLVTAKPPSGPPPPTGTVARRSKPLLFECGWHVCPNPAVSTVAELQDGRRFMYTFNLTSDLDELYDLADLTYRDLAKEEQYAPVKAEMIRRLGAILQADPRWTCYWHTLRLAKYDELDVGGGDFQMLRPEK